MNVKFKQVKTVNYYDQRLDILLYVCPNCNPVNICWSSRRLQYVSSVTIFRLPRRLEDVSQYDLKTPSRLLQDMSWSCLQGIS